MAGLALAAGILCWFIFRTGFSRKPDLPDRPSTTATAPAAAVVSGHYGVKVGDTVDISALNPVVAAKHAVITDLNDDQVKILVGTDTFTIRWKNVDRIKIESK